MAERLAPYNVPENLFNKEAKNTPDTIDDVYAERDRHEDAVEAAEEAMRNSAGASRVELREIMTTLQEADARLDGFNEMWADFGGADLDAAEEEVQKWKHDTSSTRYSRAMDDLKAAEDAFMAKMNTARDDIYDEAAAEQAKFLKTDATRIKDSAQAEVEAYAIKPTIDAQIAGRVTDEGDAWDQAQAEQAKFVKTDGKRVKDQAQAEVEAYAMKPTIDAQIAGRVTDINDAYDQATAEQARFVKTDATRVKDVDQAYDEAMAMKPRIDAEIAGRVVDINDAYDQADKEDKLIDKTEATRVKDQAQAEAEAYAMKPTIDAQIAGRVIDINDAWDQAHAEQGARTSIRGRLRAFFRRTRERLTARENRAAVIIGIGTVAAAGVALYFALRHNDSSGLSSLNTGGSGKGVGEAAASGIDLDGGDKTYGVDQGAADKPYGVDQGGGDKPYGVDGNTGSGLETNTTTGDLANLPEFDSSTQKYPFDWVKDAFPGLTDSEVMDKTRELAQLAEDNGYDVAWHKTEKGGKWWLEINNNDNPKYIVDIFRAVANK